jgi:hypothetical protein
VGAKFGSGQASLEAELSEQVIREQVINAD